MKKRICCLPVEGIRQQGGIHLGALLLIGELLFHREDVVVNDNRHHGWQEAGHHLQILAAQTQSPVRHERWTPD